jgi:sugar lactone lactonase YvrE
VTPEVDAGSVAVDAAGFIYVTNYTEGSVRRIAPDGQIRTVATGLFHPHAVAVGSGHDLFIADTENRRIRRLDMATLELSTVGGDVGITVYLAVAPDGSVYSADVARDGAGGGITKTTPEGTTTRVLSDPDVSSVAVALDGTVYVTRWGGKRIDRLVGGRLEPVARG